MPSSRNFYLLFATILSFSVACGGSSTDDGSDRVNQPVGTSAGVQKDAGVKATSDAAPSEEDKDFYDSICDRPGADTIPRCTRSEYLRREPEPVPSIEAEDP